MSCAAACCRRDQDLRSLAMISTWPTSTRTTPTYVMLQGRQSILAYLSVRQNPFPVIEPYFLAMTSFGGKRERRRTEKIEPSFWRESWISTIVRAMPNYDLRPLYPIELCWIRIERVHNMSQHLRACDLNLNTERSISINSSSDS